MNASLSRQDGRNWALVFLDWAIQRFRPALGWVTFLAALLLLVIAVFAVREARWVNVSRYGVVPEWTVLVGLSVAWLFVRRAQQFAGRRRFFGALLLFLGWLGIGVVVISQVMLGWIPSIVRLQQTAVTQNWPGLFADILAQWTSWGWRLQQWWIGVQAGGALQDDIVFLTMIVTVLWLLGGLTAWLALRSRSGLLTALPALWTLTLILYYGSGDRYLLIVSLALAILLHLWLDQRNLEADWQRRRIDFSTALIIDRAGVVLGITLVVLVVAWLIPSPRVEATMRWAYDRLAPVYQPIEETGKRLFPDLERPMRGRLGGGIGDGLPNSFLLGAGPYLSEIPVMWVGTNRTFTSNLSDFYEEPSLRFYMRRATFAEYNGGGWANPVGLGRSEIAAQRNWTDAAWTDRILVRQWVRLADAATLLYATGEPVEVSINYQATLRSPFDLVALWADGEPVDRYDVVSAAPSVDEETLLAWPGFGADRPLPEDLAIHLQLPDTVTQRTRDLAARLVEGEETPYAQARAIEQYLRGFTYDLDVSEPPADVDVADYFLFDLQRGYCDYYATAFAVLARTVGLPTRFVTGYVPGGWNPEAQEWVITEAEAHSWPEVYFPDLGWVPFEPTAGRSVLSRVDLESGRSPLSLPPVQPQENAPDPAPQFTWNWQMLVWLIPLFGLALVGWRWLTERRHRDPWRGLIRWGGRLGRPYQDVETELEYGRGLAGHITAAGGEPERARRLSRSVLALTEDVSTARYAPEDVREEAVVRAAERWREVRRD